MSRTDRRPAWRRHGHLVAGVVVTVAAMLAVAVLHFQAAGVRNDIGSVVDLALDTGDSLLADAPQPATEALHVKLLTAVDELNAPAELVALRRTLAAVGPQLPAKVCSPISTSRPSAIRSARWNG
jgi:hypothetical protein